MRTRKRLIVLAGLGAVVVGSLVLVRAAVGAPARLSDAPPIEQFDPVQLGRVEQEAWAAYYYRDWPRLAGLLWQLMAGQYGLGPARAVHATYLATRAQVVWAERGAAGGEAERLMREFYALVREPSGGRYDAARAAELEIAWWAIHRNRADYPDTSALVEALAALWAEVYQLPADTLGTAAHHRADAMEASDRWIAEGKDPASLHLATVRDELVRCYTALRAALDARQPAVQATVER